MLIAPLENCGLSANVSALLGMAQAQNKIY
jgi:hypothetical protein